jgi:hypothetical protein
MYFVARYPGLTEDCVMRWDYFGSGHGKGKALIVSGCNYILYSNFIIGFMSISGISPLMKLI